jgi:hypothetical protein
MGQRLDIVGVFGGEWRLTVHSRTAHIKFPPRALVEGVKQTGDIDFESLQAKMNMVDVIVVSVIAVAQNIVNTAVRRMVLVVVHYKVIAVEHTVAAAVVVHNASLYHR